MTKKKKIPLSACQGAVLLLGEYNLTVASQCRSKTMSSRPGRDASALHQVPDLTKSKGEQLTEQGFKTNTVEEVSIGTSSGLMYCTTSCTLSSSSFYFIFIFKIRNVKMDMFVNQ